MMLAMLLSEYECGSPLTVPGHQLHGKVLVRMNLDCTRPIKTSYFSSSVARSDLCYYCGAPDGIIDNNLT